MGRARKPLEMKKEPNGQVYIAVYWHPVRQRTERIPLDIDPGLAGKKLGELNAIFLNSEHWRNPPAKIASKEIRDAWLGPDAVVTVEGSKLKQAGKERQVKARDVAYANLDAEHWKSEYHKLLTKFNALERENKDLRGRKYKTSWPKLHVALKDWLSKYKGRDSDWTKIVAYDLTRFAKHFGDVANTEKDITVDRLEGCEKDIEAWLRGLTRKTAADKTVPIGAGRRQQIRRIVLRFLDDLGVQVHRKSIASVKRKEVRAGRGAIRWLEKEQAKAVAEALKAPWSDMFCVQVGLGLRPDELITLKRSDFTSDFSELALSPLDHLTLKQGSRRIQVPMKVRKIVSARLDNGDIVFPDPDTKKAWDDPKRYNRQFNTALTAAGKIAGVPFTMDCRIGRRTCGSLLLRAGYSTESVGAILGDDPATVREHYARILAPEVDPTPAAI